MKTQTPAEIELGELYSPCSKCVSDCGCELWEAMTGCEEYRVWGPRLPVSAHYTCECCGHTWWAKHDAVWLWGSNDTEWSNWTMDDPFADRRRELEKWGLR